MVFVWPTDVLKIVMVSNKLRIDIGFNKHKVWINAVITSVRQKAQGQQGQHLRKRLSRSYLRGLFYGDRAAKVTYVRYTEAPSWGVDYCTTTTRNRFLLCESNDFPTIFKTIPTTTYLGIRQTGYRIAFPENLR